jgi:hypothetical protein
MLYTTAMVYPVLPPPAGPEASAVDLVAGIFSAAGWKVDKSLAAARGRHLDLVARRGRIVYAIEVKGASEGRGDRLVPLWSQACLQIDRLAARSQRRMAVVVAPRIAPKSAEQILRFAAEHAPKVAAGVVDFAGLRVFSAPELESLNRLPDPRAQPASSVQGRRARLFSDANQWMLKLILAPELPVDMIGQQANRGRFANARQLGQAAAVSAMSASRFAREFRAEGYLEESGGELRLVRRADLFRRWKSDAALVPAREVPVRAVIKGRGEREMGALMSNRACLGLFAAADALRLGFVRGVAPHLYVEKIEAVLRRAERRVVPCGPNELPDFILREAPAPRSIFGAMLVKPGRPGVNVSDAIQVWLDVSSHPSRGEEQAAVVERRVIGRFLNG